MKEKTLYILGLMITVWLGYIAYKYLWEAPYGYEPLPLIIGVVALVTFVVRGKRIINGLFPSNKQDTYSYITPMLKAAKTLLGNEYSNFRKKIHSAIDNKDFYFTDENNRKYCTEQIAEDDYEKLNTRYLKMAKHKDIKITKRDGLKVKEFVSINDVGDDLERYLFVYSQEKKLLIHMGKDELQTKLEVLMQPHDITLSFDFLDEIEAKYKENDVKYSIKHDALSYSTEIWSEREIAIFLETAVLLEKKGYIFFLAHYNSDDRWFGLVPKKSYKKLNDLTSIGVVSIRELLTMHLGERFYTFDEEFQMFYKDIESKIAQDEYEIIYKISAKRDPLKSLSQIGGLGVGVDDENHPVYGDTPMQHICTFDVNDFPHLKVRYQNIRAISLYISDYNDNEAYEQDTVETRVLFLSQEDIENRKLKKSADIPTEALNMDIEPYKIPKGLLSKSILDYEEDSSQRELSNYFYNFNYVGGSATWIQSGYGMNDTDGFIAQFGENLFPYNQLEEAKNLNFGGGVMYVFEDVAFWECG